MPVASHVRKLRADALSIFRAGLKSADAGEAVTRHVHVSDHTVRVAGKTYSLREYDRCFVVGAGKAGAAMARALEQVLGSARIDAGIVNVKRGHATPKSKQIRLNECAHPVPDRDGLRAAQAIEQVLSELTARDLLFVVVSGGASALLPAPVKGIKLADKERLTDQLLHRGADIFELNTVRKHLSTLKGGQLAALAYPATVVSLILSDVIGDPLDVIGSGLTAPDETTYGDALRVLAKYGLTKLAQRSVVAWLELGAKGEFNETPKPGDPIFANVQNVIVGSNRLALVAASQRANQLGYRTFILSSTMQGEAREVAKVHAQILRESIGGGGIARPPICLLSGGETTVTVKGKGRGGRNQEFALSAALSLAEEKGWALLSGGTDGTDGPTDAAGAAADETTMQRAEKAHLSGEDRLAANDSYHFFQPLGDLIVTGPTGTNVMDLNVLLAR